MRFDVSLQSVKKIESADIIVGIGGAAGDSSASKIVVRDRDSNKRYPLRRKEALQRLGSGLHGAEINGYVLDAIIYTYECKSNSKYIWKAIGSGSMQYSHEFVSFVKRLSRTDLESAKDKYKQYLAGRRRKKRSDR